MKLKLGTARTSSAVKLRVWPLPSVRVTVTAAAVSPGLRVRFEEKTITAVREMVGPREVGLFIFDAGTGVRRDIDCYCDRFAQGCWVVIDDYFSESVKGGPTRMQVDELVSGGQMQSLGFYGWGTWVGRWLAG